MANITFICNYLSDYVINSRDVKEYSAAGNNKISSFIEIINSYDIKPTMLSIGRAKSKNFYYRKEVEVNNKCTIITAPYTSIPIIGNIIPVFFFIKYIYEIRKNKNNIFLFYNKTIYYVFYLITAKIFGFKCILDYEDEIIFNKKKIFYSFVQLLVNKIYDNLIDSAVLASSTLNNYTKIKNKTVYHGKIEKKINTKIYNNKIIVLFSGTLEHDTGLFTFLEAINHIKNNSNSTYNRLNFYITGLNTSSFDVENWIHNHKLYNVHYFGFCKKEFYQEILSKAHIGLSLKKVNSDYSDTTFPSKIIEYINNNLIVISSFLPEVNKVFGDNIIYTSESFNQVAINICNIIELIDSNLHNSQILKQNFLNPVLLDIFSDDYKFLAKHNN